MTLVSSSKVIIYGAGKIGRRIFDLCEVRGIKVIQIWDNFPEKVIAFHHKELVIRPPDFTGSQTAADYGVAGATVIITTFSPNMAHDMARPLLGKGFKDIVFDRSAISEILIGHCNWLAARGEYYFSLKDCFICPARRDEMIECNVFNSSVGLPLTTEGETIVLPTLGLLLTTKCNLTCVGCNHLRDHFRKRDNIDFNPEKIVDDLRKLLTAVDFIKSVVLVGGEALVHPKFESVLRGVLALPKIGFIQLITNGTVMPKTAEVFKLLAHPRVVVEISGYGNEPGHLRVEQRKKFMDKLAEHGAVYRYDEAALWIDFGDFEERPFSLPTWEKVYKTCCFVSHDLFNGQLHKCSRSAYGRFLNKFPDYPGDYVDINSTSADQLRNRIRDYLAVLPKVCRHCNGTTTKTMPAGVQVVKMSRKKTLINQ